MTDLSAFASSGSARHARFMSKKQGSDDASFQHIYIESERLRAWGEVAAWASSLCSLYIIMRADLPGACRSVI
jgi:hypothetical protein